MQGPDQTSPPSARSASIHLPPEQLSLLQDEHTDRPEIVSVLHEAARMPQARHRPLVVVCAQMALGAIFDGDVSQSGRHDGEGEGRGPGPVPKDAVGGIVFSSVRTSFLHRLARPGRF